MSTSNLVPSSSNIHKICRICLSEKENMISLFSTPDSADTPTLRFSEMLIKTTSVPIGDDGLPTLICKTCIALLQSTYTFKILFEQSQTLLQQYLINCRIEEEHEFFETPKIESDFDSQSIDEEKPERNTSVINKTLNDIVLVKKRCRSPKTTVIYQQNDLENEIEAKLIESKVTLHPCPICTKEFSALELREHAHTHKALKKYISIKNEQKVSPNTKFFVKPLKLPPRTSIHNRKQNIHKCVHCGLECTGTQFRLHLQTHRNQNEYKCDQCERVFNKINHLNTHRVRHLKEFPYKCEKCGKGFVIKRNYDCHILIHDTNQELPHECRMCLKRFSNPEHLHRHMVIHTDKVSYSVKYKVCKCYNCLKTFKDKFDLKLHVCVPIAQAVNTHFPCKSCKKVFKNSSGLYYHNRKIHKLQTAKVLCSVCGKHVANIYNHMMGHRGEKPFQCNQCGKRFGGKRQLRQHLLVHSGLKPFVCSVCAKAFNNSYNLQVHERIHKGDRCHICMICSKGFLEKSYLKKHMNVHSKL